LFCQLDQVGQVLDIANAVRDALQEEFSETLNLYEYSRKAGSVAFGLLLLHDYDVFYKRGFININDKQCEHYWVEVFFDGEALILSAFVREESAPKKADFVLLPEDEAVSLYGLTGGRDVEWQQGDCEESVWRAVLNMLHIDKPLPEILDEIANLQ